MKLFRKILCPVNSIAALDYARDLAKESDAELNVIHVVTTPVARPGFPLEPYPVVSEEPSKLELQEIARERLDGKVRYHVTTCSGRPAELINQTADDLDSDLIVMATHGRRGVSRLFLGSVAEQVLRASKRPVLTIRPSEGG